LAIPKAVREKLFLVAGSELQISAEAGGILLKVVDSEPRLLPRQRLLVHHGSRKLDLDVAEFIRTGREQAALANGGNA
jgi:bifunctional DNA-binding transcriptional regulator/antitoxin component of YhaV-PrlF toxin-antitoxin module